MLSALKEIPNRIGLTRDHAHTTPSLSSNEVSVEILAFANTCLFCLHETSYKMFEMSRPEKRCYRVIHVHLSGDFCLYGKLK